MPGVCRYNCDLAQYSYLSPLEGYESLPPLPAKKKADKSFENPQTGVLSKAYEKFVPPICNGRPDTGHVLEGGDLPGFDAHIYFDPGDAWEVDFAQKLWERIRYEFPELRIFKIWHTTAGPHAAGMFEVNIFTPAQFGAFVAWLVINRGPLSVLVHPNTDDELRDHIQRFIWLGKEVPLDMGVFKLREDHI